MWRCRILPHNLASFVEKSRLETKQTKTEKTGQAKPVQHSGLEV